MVRFLIITFLSLTPFSNANAEWEPLRYIIIDGDSIKREGIRYRLHGIDAPEITQKCLLDRREWSCGQSSKEFLEKLHSNVGFQCKEFGMDRYKRIIAKCYVMINSSLRDVGELMILEGMALAYKKYSDDYSEFETISKSEKKGIWSSSFMLPWLWRKK